MKWIQQIPTTTTHILSGQISVSDTSLEMNQTLFFSYQQYTYFKHNSHFPPHSETTMHSVNKFYWANFLWTSQTNSLFYHRIWVGPKSQNIIRFKKRVYDWLFWTNCFYLSDILLPHTFVSTIAFSYIIYLTKSFILLTFLNTSSHLLIEFT